MNIPLYLTVEDMIQFIEFFFLKKLSIRDGVWDQDVENYYKQDKTIPRVSNQKLFEKLQKKRQGTTEIFSEEGVKGSFTLKGEDRFQGFQQLITIYKGYYEAGEEENMLSSFYHMYLKTVIDEFSEVSNNAYIYQDEINTDRLHSKIFIYLNIIETVQEVELKGKKVEGLHKAIETHLSLALSALFIYLAAYDFLEEKYLLLFQRFIQLSIRDEFYRRGKEKLLSLPYIVFTPGVYSRILNIYRHHPKHFSKENVITMKKIADFFSLSAENTSASKEYAPQIKEYEEYFQGDTIDCEVRLHSFDIVTERIRNKKEYEKYLKSHIIGQNHIIEAIVNDYLDILFLQMNQRPISFLFLGESGTGKTELGKQLAEVLDTKYLYIPLGNFNDKHTLQTLLGAPPSYVGYGTPTIIESYAGELNETKIPIIIFDEIEKGHPELQNMFLELLDEGTITLLNGQTLSFHNAIIIFTSNLGIKGKNIGFQVLGTGTEVEELKKHTMDTSARAFFRPELYNRLSAVFYFKSLSKKDITKIIKLKIRQKIEDLSKNKLVSQFLQKIGEIDETNIYKLLDKELKLDSIENIRKIESRIEKILSNKIAKYVKKSK